ncbi:cytochrome oxidase assembly [Flammeovirgaceae bacterium 311]|nr:cytochrome oxidase assembly [Flammeovirgaceae bacterium 311]
MQKPTHIRLIRAWLWLGIILVSMMVLIGGITRLTGSGLSMVEWKPVTGILPPLDEQQWQEAFDAYKQFPEYQKINFTLELQEFKGIFWWEYVHRLLGRFTGLAFLLPFLFFLIKKQLPGWLLKRLLLIFCLGALQGLMGWVMVKSGLQDIPHVSPYRLAAHLSLALLLIGVLLWTLKDLDTPQQQTVTPSPMQAYRLAQLLLLLVFSQIMLGAFVAGLKAGFSYNSFPLMGNSFFPHNAYSSAGELLSNGPAVQFMHRWFGFIVLATACYFVYASSQLKRQTALKKTGKGLLLVLLCQVIVGIATLMLRVPLVLGVVHQLVAVLLFALTVRALYQARLLVKQHSTNGPVQPQMTNA